MRGMGKVLNPIYNILIEILMDSNRIEKYCLVVPARWFSGGKGLDPFRNRMIQDKKIKKINLF